MSVPPEMMEQFHQFPIDVEDGESRCGYFNGNTWSYSPWVELIGGMTFFKTGNYTQEPIPTNQEPEDPPGDGHRTTVMLRDVTVQHDAD